MTTITTSLIRPAASTRAAPARAADVASVAAAGFVTLLAVLHAVKSDLSPTWRMVSEYAIGPHGWLMALAFLTLAAACVATIVAVTPHTDDRAGRVGRVALGVTAAALVLAAFATTDPVTATPEELTVEGKIHGFAAMIGMPAFPIAALAIRRSLRRHGGVSVQGVHLATVAVVVALVAFGASMVAMFDGPPADPSVRIGIQNRLLVVSQAAWLITAARATRAART